MLPKLSFRKKKSKTGISKVFWFMNMGARRRQDG